MSNNEANKTGLNGTSNKMGNVSGAEGIQAAMTPKTSNYDAEFASEFDTDAISAQTNFYADRYSRASQPNQKGPVSERTEWN
ncbi:hypothetical protein [Neobacillus mesonae]|uniref:hypothetical protein n=1 Tax=Neobacillus mesonae TaxID=1193713 RepID=UPI00203D2E1F|nr:hypothetical protein [Neobacillus mesonae]MCM3570581.1 hypothetical protein [Neobacillus mesonae]